MNCASRFPAASVRRLATSASTCPMQQLHAAWASLAAYDSDALGAPLQKAAEAAKRKLNSAGFQQTAHYVIVGGPALSFDGTQEVTETDAAYLWAREEDGSGILAFRGSDTMEDLSHTRDPRSTIMFGRTLHAGITKGEFLPLAERMDPVDFCRFRNLTVTGHSLGGACACLFAVLINDPTDPLAFGSERKCVDALFAFAPPPVFSGEAGPPATNGQRPSDGVFPGGIFRAVRQVASVEVQDRAFNLAVADDFRYPCADLVDLRSGRRAPEITPADRVTQETLRAFPLDESLFPLHNPMHYVNWLGV